jgi:hypothetical protein
MKTQRLLQAWCFVTLFFCFSPRSVDATTPYLMDPGPSQYNDLWLAPENYSGLLDGPAGIVAYPPYPLWAIAQWYIPLQLSTTSTGDGNGGWSIANPYAAVHRYDGTNGVAVELSQDGAYCPPPLCQPSQPSSYPLVCGDEFDLFLFPIDGNYSGYTPGILPLNSTKPINPKLSALNSLQISFNAQIVYESITPRCEKMGFLDYAYYTAAVVLVNNFNPNAIENLSYEIILRNSQEPNYYSFFNYACDPSTPSTGVWYQTGPKLFGVSDDVPNIDPTQHCLPYDNMPHAYTLDILTRLKTLIAFGGSKNGYGMDPMLSHWQVSGLYIGTGLQGSAVVTSIYSDINLIGY